MDAISSLLRDDNGFAITLELVMIAAIVVIGLIAGLTAVRDSVVCELSDVAGSVQDLNQSYSANGVRGPSSSTAGFNFRDARDIADTRDDRRGIADNNIRFSVRPRNELSRVRPRARTQPRRP
jgi:Flp pilus assembly pilin Flp